MYSFVGGLFMETLRKSDTVGKGDASKSVAPTIVNIYGTAHS